MQAVMPVHEPDRPTRISDELLETVVALVEGLRQPVVLAAVIAIVVLVVLGDATGIH
jgi:hypothetical protein